MVCWNEMVKGRYGGGEEGWLTIFRSGVFYRGYGGLGRWGCI